MDTSTHFVMGVGLYGLAHLSPAVTSQPETAAAIMLGTIIGSQIPDIDFVYRFTGKDQYIKNHRGWSHSLPMLFLWPTLLTLIITLIYSSVDWTLMWFWTFIAVLCHVFIDLFNTYGTQALRPISKKWISWNIIYIFDPTIFFLHVVGFIIWVIKPIPPGYIFSIVYLLMIIYLVYRSYVQKEKLAVVKNATSYNQPCRYTITPTLKLNVWNVIVERPDIVRFGRINYRNEITWTDEISTRDCTHPAVQYAKLAPSVQIFLAFTSYGYPKVEARDYGYEVKWIDVRYHYKKHFPFIAVALLDKEFQLMKSFAGWMNEEQLQRKTNNITQTVKNV